MLGGEKEPKAEIRETFIIEEGDAFVICTDGFWEHISETEMRNDLRKASNAKEWAEHMLARIGKRLPEDGDNYSLICGLLLE